MSPRILLGVGGGIAAYKAAELVRALQTQGHTVRVMMTASATQFIAPLTFATLTGHKVYTSLWTNGADAKEIEHITQAQWADLVLLAPASANTLAKLAHGLADDFVTTTCLATTAPVLLAPAMNTHMWANAATNANLEVLRERGFTIVAPDSGDLACGMVGPGRLADLAVIVQAAHGRLTQTRDLAGEVVLITAGGTREPVDAVRFLGNRSSGRMGYALAAAAAQRGARVILVSAPTSLTAPQGCESLPVETAEEMCRVVLDKLHEASIVIMAAAVADFRVEAVAQGKLERSEAATLRLVPTEDIVRQITAARRSDTLVIAFAAEMGLNLERARNKMLRKGADAIFVNDISQAETGFDSERNAGVLLTAASAIDFPVAPKQAIAHGVLNAIAALRNGAR